MKRIAIALLFLTGSARAEAQTSNPVVQHYRVYESALERGDLSGAEVAARAALEASEARDGDGGRTAVLALNLATVRFLKGDMAGALQPGRRALALTELLGEASGVPRTLAQLVVARAELALNYETGAALLRPALEAAQAERLAPSEIYDAATDLGRSSLSAGQFGQAQEAWSIAASYAEGARFPRAFAFAQAQTGAGASAMMGDLTRRGRGRGKLSEEAAHFARSALVQAIELLAPLAEIESPDGEMTIAQTAYADALAWRAVLRAKMAADNIDVPEDLEAQGDGANEIDVPAGARVPRCQVQIRYRGNIAHLFPGRALDDGAIAGLAVRYRVNEAGEVVEARTVARVGRVEFARSVDNSSRRWRVTRLPESPPGCRMAMTVITSISFRVS
jgi:tetratricopeptide (TPR) repeat protein